MLGRRGDQASNAFLLAQLAGRAAGRRRPVRGVGGRSGPASRLRRVWIIDPLDGTREFAMPGRDDWAVHVALWEAGRRHHRRGRGPAGDGRAVRQRPAAAAPGPADGPAGPRILVSDSRPPAFAGRRGARSAPTWPRWDRPAPRPWPWCAATPTPTSTPAASGSGTRRPRSGWPWRPGLHASRLDGSPVGVQPAPPVPARPARVPDLAGRRRSRRGRQARRRLRPPASGFTSLGR